MVEGSGLENRQGRKSFVSSNLTHAVRLHRLSTPQGHLEWVALLAQSTCQYLLSMGRKLPVITLPPIRAAHTVGDA